MIHYENRSRCTNQFELIYSSHLELSFSASTLALLILFYYYSITKKKNLHQRIQFHSSFACSYRLESVFDVMDHSKHQ